MDRVFCARCRGEAVRGGGRALRHAVLVWQWRGVGSCAAVGRPGMFLSWKSGHGVGCAQSRLRGDGCMYLCAQRSVCVCLCVFVSVHRPSTMVA